MCILLERCDFRIIDSRNRRLSQSGVHKDRKLQILVGSREQQHLDQQGIAAGY